MHKIFFSRLTFLALMLLGSLSMTNAQTITGRVWNDANNNGLQDSGEMSLGSVWIQVRDAATNATPAGAQGYTAMDGTYSYSVPAGSYKVKVANPGNGFNGATPNVGSNDAIDSDVDIYGNSAVFAVGAGQTVTIDGGFTTGGQCYTPVTATTSNVVCSGSTFSFAITASGGTSFGGNSWGWDYAAGNLSMQSYGQPHAVGPFPCGSPATVTITDHDNPYCSATVTVASPACCGGGGGTTPSVSISDVTVNENAGTASLTVSLSAPSATPTTVTVTTSNGTATSGADYTPVTTTVTIPAGATSATVTFPIVDDTTGEPTEVFNATLSNPTGATIADGSGTVTILDNDSTGGDPCAGISITAGANNTIVVNGLNAQYSKIKVLNSAFATVFSQTYTAAPGTVTVPTLPSGTYSVKVTVMQANFSVICTKEVSITTGTTPTTPSLSITDVTVNESAGTASLQICASQSSTSPMTVQYSTANGTALSGSDYTSSTALATIPAGQTCVNVTFPIVNDNTNEPTESFNVNLTNPTGATIADNQGKVTILDDDNAGTVPSVSISDITVNENAGTASLIVSLSAPSSTPTTVTVTTSNGTATSGADYTPVTMTVTIPAGSTSATVTFPIIDDTTGEPTEVFNATLSNPTGAAIADGSGTVTILDNDGTGDPCAGVSITPGANNTIIVSGLTAQYSKVKVLNSSFASVFSQTYTSAPGTVTVPTLPAGTYSVKVTVLQANLSTIICTKEVTITTGGTPTPPTVSISDVTVNENAGTASLTVSLSAPSATPTTVTVTTSNGTATSGADYTPVTTTVTIPAGATSAVVTFPIVDDNTNEPTEVFNATLSNPSGATIADGQGTITILDNDAVQNPPVANPDATTTPQNTPVTISPLVNDNLNGGALQMLMVVSNPSNGSVVLNGTNYVYTPNAGFSGTDVFTYKIVASNGTSNTTTVTITVPQPQPAPVANPDVTTTPQNTPVTISPLVNDNLNGGTLQMVMLVSNPSNGTAVLNGTNYVYTPNAGFSGTDVFTYKIVASNGTSNTTTVTVTVPQPQPAPVANPDATTTPQNTPVTITPLVNDNLNGGTLQMLMVVSNPSNGTVVLNGTNYVYTPNAGFSGTDVFTYKIVASNGTSNTTTVTVTVPQPQPAPVANNDATTTPQNTPVTISPLVNDNLNGGTLQMLMLVSNPSNGTVVLNGTNYVYTPNAGFSGNDSFTYKIVASNGTSNTATVNITVPQPVTPPVANNDNATTNQNTPVTINPLPNDNLNGGTLQMVMLVSNPSNGSVVLNGTSFVYTPNAGFTGNDSFTYKLVASNGTSNIATVNVSVAGPSCNVTRNATNSIESCGSGNAYGVWFNVAYPGTTSTNGNCQRFSISNGSFVENADGTAKFTGVATNNCNSNIKFNIDVDFCGRTFVAPSGSPKTSTCYTTNANGYYYYTKTCGTLTGTNGAAGAVIKITRRGEAFQVGTGANLNQNVFGASGWFNVFVTSQPTSGGQITSTEGDININLSGTASAPACGTGTANCNNTVCYAPLVCTVTGNTISKTCANGVAVFTGSAYGSNYEYQWMKSTTGCASNLTAIAGATGQNYTAPNNTVTTYIIRCVRPIGCTIWNGTGMESNCITLSPNHCAPATCTTYNITASSGTYCNNGTSTNMVIQNLSNTMCKIYFKNSWGQEVWYKDLAGGASYTQQTYKSHWWVIRKSDGTHLKTWQVTNCNQTVTINCTQYAVASNAALTFNAARQESAAQLKWVSNSGDINDYFAVERSADGNEWTEIATVDGRGNAGELLQFNQLDTEAAKGDNYYRIRQVFQDGSINYSQVEKVFIPNARSFGLYPNPAKEEVFVETSAFEGQSVTVLVHNQLGKVVKTIEVAEATDAVRIALDGMENGFYTVTAISKGVQRASKLVIHKAE